MGGNCSGVGQTSGPMPLVNGVSCSRLARLKPDGWLDRTFQPSFLSMREFGQKRIRVYSASPRERDLVGYLKS